MRNLNERTRNVICAVLGVLSVALIATGVCLGEPSVVLAKAAAICMQCIGLG